VARVAAVSKISPTLLYEELLAVDRQLVHISKLLAEAHEVSRATNHAAVEWRVKMDAFKQEHGFST
jgi:hypothetical protein